MTDQVDKLTVPQMEVWLRDTATSTRRHSDPQWCARMKVRHDPVAAHVAFRLEQAASMLAALYIDHRERASGDPDED
jgi:hypothetical protein